MARSNNTSLYLAFLIGIIAVAIRLIGITQPFVDNWSWRQSDVAAIARNFYRGGFHFTRPQIDWGGESAGYVGTEFPILPFAAALVYKITGVHEWVGRSESVLFFAGSLPFFYLLVRRLLGETTAIWSLIFYSLAPLGIAASRAFMPDGPSLSLSIAGLYFFLRWVENDNWKFWLSAALLISLALLIKLPTAIIGAPLFYLSWRKFGVSLFRQPKIWLFGALALFPSAIWYWHALGIAERYYPHHFFGAGGFQIEGFVWYWKIVVQTATSSLTPIVFGLAFVGGFVVPPGGYRQTIVWWFAAMVAFVLLVGYGNRHQWYQLPLVPIAAIYASCACVWMASKFSGRRVMVTGVSMLLLIALGAGSFLYARPFFASSAKSLWRLGPELKTKTPRRALIIAADDGDPTVFYYAERKGWHFLEDGIYQGNPIDSRQAIANLEKLRGRGASYFVFYAGTLWWMDYYKEFGAHLAAVSEVIEATPEFAIYRLKSFSK